MMTQPQSRVRLLAVTVGTSAFLLFGMEPLVGRLLMPYFGGAVHVWLTCLMFFQATLFLGYLYAHLAAPRLGRWHLAVIVLPVLVLPLQLESVVGPDEPMRHLLFTLVRYVALPFFALSTTAVVVQSWFARSDLGLTQEPYPLYAASNIGSLVALLGYPLLVEPYLGLTAQRTLWTIGYVGFVALVAASWWAARASREPVVRAPETAHADVAPSTADYAWWITLSALPSAFLLATTNVVASEVGSAPLTWVIPLALYLATFIIAFRDREAEPRDRAGSAVRGTPWPEALLLGGLVFAFGPLFRWTALVFYLVLFVLALAMHRALYAKRPHPRHLTAFYLSFSLGGWVGGAVITFFAPAMFDRLVEYPLLLVGFAAVFVALDGRGLLGWLREAPVWLGGPRVAGWTTLAVLTAYVGGVRLISNDVARYRTFYGTYRVSEVTDEETGAELRMLFHGLTAHGVEVIDGTKTGEPVFYYDETRCLARIHEAIDTDRRAILGLGAGVLAIFDEPGSETHFYEIDGENEAIARRWFSYLDRAEGEVEVRVGDGRLRIAEQGEHYGLIIVDAFSGDGIPTHLMTREALATYVERLAPGGVVVFHVSNRFYALTPIVERVSADLGLAAAAGPPVSEILPPLASHSHCVAVAKDEAALAALVAADWRPFDRSDLPPPQASWTDDYVNLLWSMRERYRRND